jgi:hypothetical protein
LNTSPSNFRVIKSRITISNRQVPRVGDIRNVYEILVGERDSKAGPTRAWDDNIRMDLKQVVRV